MYTRSICCSKNCIRDSITCIIIYRNFISLVKKKSRRFGHFEYFLLLKLLQSYNFEKLHVTGEKSSSTLNLLDVNVKLVVNIYRYLIKWRKFHKILSFFNKHRKYLSGGMCVNVLLKRLYFAPIWYRFELYTFWSMYIRYRLRCERSSKELFLIQDIQSWKSYLNIKKIYTMSISFHSSLLSKVPNERQILFEGKVIYQVLYI